MKIRAVSYNNRKKVFEIKTSAETFVFEKNAPTVTPLSKMRLNCTVTPRSPARCP